MIMGEIPDVKALQLRANDSPDDLQNAIKAFIDRYQGNCVILLDLFGGTPCNSVLKLSRTMSPIYAVTGMNVPMLLESLVLRNTLRAEEMPAALEKVGKQGILDLHETIKHLHERKHDEEEEDD